ncbi:2-acylglycerol O-acyltransferase 3 [Crotalus adamanteus]|uniref:2-acylglycerol O-acyltransferase 3 n=1 Tax=Crotalus adamanteus TaxID=8729 RepID=A0AAW1BAK0_CROAD
MAWLYLYWETPSRGGHCSAWTVWRYFQDYFPIMVSRGTGRLPLLVGASDLVGHPLSPLGGTGSTNTALATNCCGHENTGLKAVLELLGKNHPSAVGIALL